jgi:ribonuclease BN (tRNA processing enzyme)
LIAAWVQLNAFANTGLQFKDLKAMFVTHLHTDHIVDYYSFFASGGFQAPPGRAPVLVYGPGPAGGLPPDEVGNPNPATIDPPPADPAPGLAANTAALHQAFAYTNNIFIRDFGTDDIEDLVKVTEIAVCQRSFGNPAARTGFLRVGGQELFGLGARRLVVRGVAGHWES